MSYPLSDCRISCLLYSAAPKSRPVTRVVATSRVVEKIFTGSGECAVVDWTFLGLSMPAWTLVWYVILGVGALWAGFRRR